METREHFADFFRLAKLGHGVGDGVVVFEAQQRREFFLFKFLHAHADVMLEDEIEEDLLLGVELRVDVDARLSGANLFDVLAHVAYAKPPETREVRAAQARVYINTQFSAKQQVFLDFVLQHYVSVGVEELDQEKLTPLLRLKYHNSIADAVADLGRPEEIGKVFAGFQRYLYAEQAA